MIIARAPLRVSFLGGGTDYPEHFLKHGGAILGTAIHKFSYVTANSFPSHLFDYAIRVSYRKVELVRDLADIEHAVYRECLRLLGLEKDIELHNVADLPAFTGLGSSSTFTVSLLQALHAFKGQYLAPLKLAYEAIHVERGILGESVGCQDQTLAAMGGFRLLEFRREDDVAVHRVPVSPARLAEFEQHLVLVYTGIRRRANDVAASQLRNVDRNRDILLQMRSMVDRGYDVLTGSQPISAFGELLHQGWMAKRGLDQMVSNSEIDQIYEVGRSAGAFGGKLLGAGAGGFVLFVIPPDKHDDLRRMLPGHEVMPVRVDAPGVEIVLAM